MDSFILHVGFHCGNNVGSVVQPWLLHPGGLSPGGGKIEPGGAGGQSLGPATQVGGGGGGGPNAVSLKKYVQSGVDNGLDVALLL